MLADGSRVEGHSVHRKAERCKAIRIALIAAGAAIAAVLWIAFSIHD